MAIGSFQKLSGTIDEIFAILSKVIPVNTFFVASNDNHLNTITQTFNKNRVLVQEGTVLPFEETYCYYVTKNPQGPVVIENTGTHSFTCTLKVTEALGTTSFIGVPITLSDGRMIGTICGLDPEQYRFTEDDVILVQHMAGFLSKAIELELATRQVQQDLELARRFQAITLAKPLKQEGLCIDGRYLPSAQLSGDLYTWVSLSEYEAGIMILDVAGHGASAALIAMSLRSLLQDLMTALKEPKQVMGELNRRIFELFGEGVYVTGIYAVVNTEQRTIKYVNAGHPGGILVGPGAIVYLESNTIPLGVLPDMPVRQEVLIYQAARLFLFTDGLYELAEMDVGVRYRELLRTILLEEGADREALLERIIHQMGQGCRQEDDIALVQVDLGWSPGYVVSIHGPDQIMEAMNYSYRMALRCGMSEQEAAMLKLVTEEACTNVWRYGVEQGERGWILWYQQETQLYIRVRQTGVTEGTLQAMNAWLMRSETEREDNREEHGRGLHIIRSCTSQLSLELFEDILELTMVIDPAAK